MAPHVEVVGVSKRFGGIHALRSVDVTIERGEVHALVGENGAGKSTLGKVIAGVHGADEGRVLLDGQSVSFRSPRDAIAAGIAFIAQELAIVPARSVLDNVFLGTTEHRFGLVRTRALRARYDELARRTGFELPADVAAGSLRLADQQKVEIMRAIERDAKLVIMDEPTASLAGAETERLVAVVRDLQARGVTVVFVSHFLDEALELGDHITVLKDGAVVHTRPTAAESVDSLVLAMLGRTLASIYPAKSARPPGRVALSVAGLTRRPAFDDVSFDVRAGEIVGVAGLVGAGRSEVARAIVGLDRTQAGTVSVAGSRVVIRNPRDAQRAGIVMVPESRKEQGLIMQRSVAENVSLPHLRSLTRFGVVSRSQEHRRVAAVLASVRASEGRLSHAVQTLSGGNQQKVLFAKWLLERPDVLLADEPTRGVDIGAKAAIYQLLRDLADGGTGVLFVSSDLPEVVGLADRVLVMRGGRLVADLRDEKVREEEVLRAMFEATPEEAA